MCDAAGWAAQVGGQGGWAAQVWGVGSRAARLRGSTEAPPPPRLLSFLGPRIPNAQQQGAVHTSTHPHMAGTWPWRLSIICSTSGDSFSEMALVSRCSSVCSGESVCLKDCAGAQRGRGSRGVRCQVTALCAPAR
eukprot:165315-Chlamydomonas_euryale.AAC.2